MARVPSASAWGILHTHGQDLLLQSIGGSLRLPRFQNGACPFPCTALLGVLMLVTPTDREVRTRLPGLRILAASLSGLGMGRAGVPSMPAEVLNRQRGIMLDEPPAVGTTPALSCAPRGPAGTDRWVASPSGAPLHPSPLVRTAMACALGVPQARDLTRGGERHLALQGGRWGTHPAGVPPRPVPVVSPACRGVRVASARPVAALHPGAMIPAAAGGVTPPGAVIMGPTSALGVAVAEQGGVGPSPTAANDPPARRRMRVAVGLGGRDQRVDPAPVVASGTAPGLAGSPPRLPAMNPQPIQAGLIPCHGVVGASVGDGQRQAARRPPRDAAVRAGFEDRASLMAGHAVIGRGDDPGLRRALGAGRVPPRPGEQRQPR
jgi:hypothetical protein